MNFDYIIVGAGPSGLTFAQLASLKNKKILILDKETSVSGCHRASYINNYFTEHSPRVYSSAYVNTMNIIKMWNKKWSDFFTPYYFNFTKIGTYTITEILSIYEIFILSFAFFIYAVKDESDTSIYNFMTTWNFSQKSIDYIDKICRLIDGANAHRYSVTEFFNLINQQSLYTLYQPKKPLDLDFFNIWTRFLTSNHVEIQLNTTINDILLHNNQVYCLIDQNNKKYFANQYIFAIPPYTLAQISSKNLQSILPNNFKQYAVNTNYEKYIGITFHWNHKLKLKKIWGFPQSEWGVAFINLSDYMDIDTQIISSVITISNKKSIELNKTALECSNQELKQQVFNVIKTAYDINIPYDMAIVNPIQDTAFFKAVGESFIEFNTKANNLWMLGTQNGYSFYSATSMESACSNAIALYNKLENDNILIKRPLTILSLIIIILIIFIISLNYP